MANPLTARMHKGINTTLDEGQTLIADGGGFDVAHALCGEGFDASEDGTGRGTPLVPIAIQERAVSENPNAGPDGAGVRTDGAAYTLEAQAVAFGAQNSHHQGDSVSIGFGPTLDKSKTPAVAFDMRGREGGAPLECPHDTASVRAASGGSSRSYVAQPWAVRRLTPRECERLQGFPDDFTRIPYRNKPAESCPDGPRYKALGNSWAVNCAEWIAERINEVDGWQ